MHVLLVVEGDTLTYSHGMLTRVMMSLELPTITSLLINVNPNMSTNLVIYDVVGLLNLE